MIVSGRPFFSRAGSGIYSLLPRLKPGLFLDVGAGRGAVTKLVLDRSPLSWVVAFEPFIGNCAIFERAFGSDERVTLFSYAVAETSGEGAFLLGPKAQSEDGEVGYCTGGALVPPNAPPRGRIVTVPTAALDDVVDANVRLLKVDANGGEVSVLRGASRLIAADQIDLITLKYIGQPGLVDLLLSQGFIVYDTSYVVVPREAEDTLAGWDIIGQKKLTNGRNAATGWPSQKFDSVSDYESFMANQRPKRLSAQTDLIAVRNGFHDDFVFAAKERRTA